MFECLNHVVKKDGVGALYKGAWPSILRALPSYAVSFWGYEATLAILEKNRIKNINMVKSEDRVMAIRAVEIPGKR